MKKKLARKLRNRRGTIAVLAAVMMPVLLGMAAFSVDYGYILTARTRLQAAADAAVLAAARELVPDQYGYQSYSIYTAREKVREYVNANISGVDWFHVPDDDIEIGRYDASTIYSGAPLTLLQNGIFDTVRVTLRQDGVNNDSIPLFFARVLGFDEANIQVTATALLPPVKVLRPGDGILPFAVDIDVWNSMQPGPEYARSIYGDGHVENGDGTTIPGNWGTVDIGGEENSTADIGNQVDDGLRQSDLDSLASSTSPADGQPRIPDSSEMGAPLWVNSETGLSSSLQSPLQNIVASGTSKIIPLFDVVTGTGDTAEYHIVSWGVVKVTSVDLTAALADKHLKIQKLDEYNGTFTATDDLSDQGLDNIQGAYAAAILVE
jgi:putative Flp pilus-assembly TadE/G-like protein